MTDNTLTIVFSIFGVFCLVTKILCIRWCQSKRRANRLLQQRPNLNPSPARPLIIYHIPVSPIQETLPPSYDEAIAN